MDGPYTSSSSSPFSSLSFLPSLLSPPSPPIHHLYILILLHFLLPLSPSPSLLSPPSPLLPLFIQFILSSPAPPYSGVYKGSKHKISRYTIFFRPLHTFIQRPPLPFPYKIRIIGTISNFHVYKYNYSLIFFRSNCKGRGHSATSSR